MENKRIIVLGGGYGGVLTAKKLAKKFKKDKNVEITLIDKNPYHTMLTELHEVVANRVEEESIKMDFAKIFAGRKVNFVLDSITNIDFDNKVLKSENTEYHYDILVVGTGSKPTYFGIDGAKEYAKPLWSYDDAVNLRDHILNLVRLASKETNANKRAQLLNFVVVGGGFTGVEMAGELGEYKDELCHVYGINKNEFKITLIDRMPSILPNYPKSLIKKAEKRLHKLGVDIIANVALTKVTPVSIELNGEQTIPTETLIWAAGIEGSDLMNDVNVEKNGRGRIVTNSLLQAVNYDNVYVVGDNIFYIPEGQKFPVPQMVENAEHSASTVATNIKAQLKGGKTKEYKPSFHGSMVCIGGRYGVAEVGLPNMMFKLTGFFAMFSKHFINIIYFLQVLGFAKVYSYLKHEIFKVRNRRSFVGGHFSNAQMTVLTVPLRLFLGYMWLTEGLAKLPKILDDFTKIFLFPALQDGSTGATGAASIITDAIATATGGAGGAATDAVSQWGEALWRPDFITNIVDWSMQTFFITNGEYNLLAQIVQAGMVFGEIAVGVLFLFGLFTPIAAAISVAMCGMIWASGMAPQEILWYGFASVAVSFSGMSFGLDYYVWPWLNEKVLRRFKFTKKWYLYID